MDFEEVMRVAALNKQKAKSDLKSREQNVGFWSVFNVGHFRKT